MIAQDRCTYGKVAIGTAALGESLADLVYEVLLAASRGADALLLELDLRHGVRSRVRNWRSEQAE